MFHTAWFWVWHWYVSHGVAGNLAGDAITFVIGYLAGRRSFRSLAMKIQETHRLVHHVNAEKAAEIGHKVPD